MIVGVMAPTILTCFGFSVAYEDKSYGAFDVWSYLGSCHWVVEPQERRVGFCAVRVGLRDDCWVGWAWGFGVRFFSLMLHTGSVVVCKSVWYRK